jgi:RimJ/RimL family protein N-acetyltransferase
LEDLFQVLSRPEVMRDFPTGPNSKAETEKFISWCQSVYQAKGYGLYAVVLPPDKRVIGYCGFHFQDVHGVPEVEICYRLHPDYWGRGIATEAAKLVRDYGFSVLKCPRLISAIERENTRSIRVAEKLGMTYWKPHPLEGSLSFHIYRVENE